MADIPKNSNGNVSDHLANERTFLAWVRTGIGIMAFGFVVVKFSLFVKQLGYVLNKQLPGYHKGTRLRSVSCSSLWGERQRLSTFVRDP